MYYVIEWVGYNSQGSPTKCTIDLRRKWGPRRKQISGWKSLIFTGSLADALAQLLKPGVVVDVSGGGVMRYPKPRQRKGGNSYGN